MDYNDFMEISHKRHIEFLASLKIFERSEDSVFVGRADIRTHGVPRWYKVRTNSKDEEFILYRGNRLYLNEIGGE